MRGSHASTRALRRRPWSAARIVDDGALVRLRRHVDAVTLRLQVGESADDSYENGGVNNPTIATPLADASDEYVARPLPERDDP